MSQHPLQYWFELPSDRYAVREVRGEESVSGTFRFHLRFVVPPTDGFDPDEIVRKDAALVLVRNGEVRRITGIVSSVTRRATRRVPPGAPIPDPLKDVLKSGVTAGGGEVEIVFTPKLTLLEHRVDIRVFRTKTVPDIVREVITAHGVPCENRLRDKYAVREYTVQFRESDMAFVSRLLEDEGIFYFVDEAGGVVLGDTPQAYDDSVGPLVFRHGAGLDVSEDSITAIGLGGNMTAGSISLRDFNPVHPRMNMDVSSDGPTVDGAEWYDYPGEYEEPSEGQRKARLRTESLRCIHHRIVGRSFSGLLRPGQIFHLGGAPAGVADGGYVVLKTTHDWKLNSGGFELGFEALPEDVTYRPPVVTPAPVQTNPLSGFVTGPAGADIHTNEWGQVKVHFPWDRIQPKDDNCSHWIPVLQDNTGHSSAMSRVRWEVLCHFMEGDPDRPVVLGRVYNARDPYFSPLPDRKARSALRSQVSPREGDFETLSNSIQFDDDAGAECIWFHAQKDQNVVVLNDKNEQIDYNDNSIVRGNETINIGGDQTIQVKKTLNPMVNGNQTVTIGGDHKIGVKSTLAETVDKDHKLEIEGDHKRQMGKADGVLVKQDIKEKIDGNVMEISVKSNGIQAEKTSKLKIAGSLTEIIKGNKTEQAGLGRLENIAGSVLRKAGKVMATRVEEVRLTTASILFRVDAVKELLIAGLDKLEKRTLSATYDGTTDVTLKVGETQIEMGKARIEFSAIDGIVIKTTSHNALKSTTASQNKTKPATPAS